MFRPKIVFLPQISQTRAIPSPSRPIRCVP